MFFSCCLGVYSGMDVCVGSFKRYRMKAIQTSKSCGIVSMYTSFTTIDTHTRNQPQSTQIRHTGTHIYCSTDNPHTISQRDCDTKQTSWTTWEEWHSPVCVLGVWFETRHRSHAGSSRQKLCSVGFGRHPSSRASEETKATHTSTGNIKVKYAHPHIVHLK